MFIDTISSPIHKDKSSHDFVQMVKKHLFKLLNVFVQIAERQQHNVLFSHSHSQRQKYCLLFRHIIGNFFTLINLKFTSTDPLEYVMLLYSKDSALSVWH